MTTARTVITAADRPGKATSVSRNNLSLPIRLHLQGAVAPAQAEVAVADRQVVHLVVRDHDLREAGIINYTQTPYCRDIG